MEFGVILKVTLCWKNIPIKYMQDLYTRSPEFVLCGDSLIGLTLLDLHNIF